MGEAIVWENATLGCSMNVIYIYTVYIIIYIHMHELAAFFRKLPRGPTAAQQ